MKRSAGQFSRECGSSLHGSNQPHTYLINLELRKRLSKKNYDKLMSSELLNEDARDICKVCFDKIITMDEDTIKEKGTKEFDLDNQYEEYLTDKAMNLARELRPFINADVKYIKNSPNIKDIEDILCNNPRLWCDGRPKPLIQFISSVCGLDVESASEDKVVLIAKIVEIIYSCINNRLVLPNHFIENLLCYSLTNCKSFLNFMSTRSPGGGYTYITNWLRDQSKDPIKFPSGLVKCVFDNSQKIGKTYLISTTNTVPTSVITSQIWITLDKNDAMQTFEEYTPVNWIENELTPEQERELIQTLTTPSQQFRQTRNKLLEITFDVVKKQMEEGMDVIEEIINIEAENQKVCLNCGCENDLAYRACRHCGRGELIKETIDFSNKGHPIFDPYAPFSECFSRLPDIECTTGEPDFLNPNSYHNIVQVLQSIGERSGVKQYGTGDREWLFVECDGLPINLIRDIIIQVLRCPTCKKCFWGSDAFNDHACFVVKQIQPKKEFGWLVPIFGLLHLEMNLGRAFLKMNWDIFVKSAGYVLGFQSPKAQSYLYKGSDHHKMWHLLEILYAAISMELAHPYIQECKEKGILPSCDNYWQWSEHVLNPNYIYMQDAVLNQLHALMMLRSGISFCSIEVI